MLECKDKGIIEVELIFEDKLFMLVPRRFDVYEMHRWVVLKNEFMISLAMSKTGIEAVKHPEKIIYGVQFHPEVFVDGGYGKLIIENFLKIVRLLE